MYAPLLLVALGLRVSLACFIQGQDSGHCVPTAGIEKTLPFCAKYVGLYPSTCLPNEYPQFPNHTASQKDQWIKKFVTDTIEHRLLVEKENGANMKLRAS
jgi:hypothetical protein